MDDRKDEVLRHNKQVFEALKGYVGTTVLLEQKQVEFCIEEGHSPHISGEYELGTGQQKSFLLVSVNSDRLTMTVLAGGQHEIEIPLKLQAGSHLGGYYLQVIDSLVLRDGRRFALDITQDEQEGFRGVFYHQLVEMPRGT